MRPFVRRHPALIVTAGVVICLVALDKLAGLRTVALVLALLWSISLADAWDEETER